LCLKIQGFTFCLRHFSHFRKKNLSAVLHRNRRNRPQNGPSDFWGTLAPLPIVWLGQPLPISLDRQPLAAVLSWHGHGHSTEKMKGTKNEKVSDYLFDCWWPFGWSKQAK
jgi:hypothetical protein